ncbi:Rhodocoxin reductase [Thalassovita gelatinovora]|uniref:Rhodocoxin reductase n=1 Tax=Thalassovita gelatinovora TaxID=53501 RepID=A0A0P1FTM0_THAGE|nr:FAD-dependent oxidoreductase [Thalassovita gelatinovora]QIZ82278.1 FAD-dependent oxidoreductase [Thalassovita gelatinovora]CUH63831.1 Rhodocoxin reductase [Thalassovita gelatinovora]SEQ97059.1 3-phenylpropionate/trans-cinnamate dioxygenase ferredoxin reductase subunit [Thalassovita gelatinovora]
MTHIAVIGAGQAGSALAAKLRNLGFDGRLSLIGAEPVPPYQRPPLSKKYMLGALDKERLFLRPETFYAEQGIDLITGARVAALDPQTMSLRIDDGTQIAADMIALTTGADPIRLPDAVGGQLDNVYTMRSLADADAAAHEFRPGRRVLIVGGGYIGLEAAAVAAQQGVAVTLVEMAPRILARVACAETADWVKAMHASHGVDIRENCGLEILSRSPDGQLSARLTTGAEIDIDFVICGIGVRPSTALAGAAGIEVDNGIKVDDYGRTSCENIFSAGDCASFPWKGARIRLESVPNAIDQAEATAATMLGQGSAYVARPWFWSDQYDTKLQIAGLNTGFDHVVTRPGDKLGSQSHWYFRGTKLLAVDAVNDPRAYMTGKRLIEAGQSPVADAVSDPATPLKALPLISDCAA